MREREKYTFLEQKVSEYFHLCDEKNEGKKDIVKPYTLSGLLCYLEITRDEFEKLLSGGRKGRVLSGAKARIEAYIEENMLTGALSCNASLNSLKYSFDWGERQPQAETGQENLITVTLSPETRELAR